MENQTRMFAALFHDLASCFYSVLSMYVCMYAASSLLMVLLRYSLER
jgi:hypothetical protein